MKTRAIFESSSLSLILASSLLVISCGNGGGGGGGSSSNVTTQCGGPTTVTWDVNNTLNNGDNVTPQNFPPSGLSVNFNGTTPNGTICNSQPQYVATFQQYYSLLSNDLKADGGSFCNTRAKRDALRAQKNCGTAGTSSGGRTGGLGGLNDIDVTQNGFIYCQAELRSDADLRWLFGTGYATRVNATLIPLKDRGARNFSVGAYQVTSKVISKASDRDNVQVEFKVKRGNEMLGTFQTGLDQVGSLSISDEETGRMLVAGCQYPNGDDAREVPDEFAIQCSGSLKRNKEDRAITFSKSLNADDSEVELFQGGDETISVSYKAADGLWAGLKRGAVIIEATGIGFDKKREFKAGGTAAAKQELNFKEQESGYELSVKCGEARRNRISNADRDQSNR